MMKQNLRFIFMALLCAVFSTAWGETATLTNANIVAAGEAAGGYTGFSIRDDNGKTWNAYAIKNQHSNATSAYHYLQIKKYASSTAYYIQVPEFGSRITSIKMTVSSTSKPMTDGGNSATLYFSNSNSTSEEGEGVASGTGASSVTIDCSSLNLNTGYITAGGAVRIWDVEVTYTSGTTPSGPTNPAVSFASSSVRVGVGATTTNVLTTPDDLTVSCSSSNPNVATYDPETGVVTGLAEGEATITASWNAVENIYNAGSISFTVTVSNTLLATFDFRGTNAYGSGLEPSAGYVDDSKTWTSNGVQLVTAGRYRWLKSTNGNSLRLHKAYDNATNGSITISPTNSSHVITKIEFDTNVSGISTMTSGTFNNIIWEGICNTITFAHDGTSDTQIIKTITITYGPAPTIPVTISNAGYATMYYGTKHLIVPEGVEAYTCKVESDHSITHTTTFTAGEVIPAGTAVLLHATAGNYTFTESVNAGNKTVSENMLRGYDTKQATTGPNGVTDGYKFFTLSLNAANDASSVGFYYMEENGAPFESEAHKAFLAVPNDIAEVSSYVFDDQTGIKTVEMSTNKEGIYTLSGVRMQSDNLPAGLYIVNGKKMIIK